MFKNKQFPNEIEKYPKDNTYFLIAFEKKYLLKTSFSPKNSLVVWSKNKKLCCNNFCTPRHLSHIIVTRWKVIFAKRLHSTLKMGKKSNNKCSHKSVVFQKTLINFFSSIPHVSLELLNSIKLKKNIDFSFCAFPNLHTFFAFPNTHKKTFIDKRKMKRSLLFSLQKSGSTLTIIGLIKFAAICKHVSQKLCDYFPSEIVPTTCQNIGTRI